MQLLLFLLTLALSPAHPPVGEDDFVNHIIMQVPDDLDTATLLIPRYDLLDAETVTGPRREFVIEHNKAAKRANSTLKEVVDKAYPFTYKLAGLAEVEDLKAAGYRYFLDMVLMPKQMEKPVPQAMEPCYQKYPTANKMYTNRYTQFHYYFYIRDLQTNDVYVGSKLQSHFETYPAMQQFFRQVKKDMAAK
ncbi:MAG: hypothetical protein OHK0039_34100 [Bacteroidia bacterium]